MRTNCCGLRNGQRSQQERIDNAEHGYVGANPQPENEHRDYGESTVTTQGAQGEAQVLPQHIHPR